MQTPRLRRLVPWGGALALGLSSAFAVAQSGAPPTGPPVTNPRTNETASPTRPPATRPQTTADVLPGVPATARDPAPPGTRSVRVDQPNTPAPGAGIRPAPGAVGATSAPAPRPANRDARILAAEGVVTRLDRAGKSLNGELERFAFDPSQDWFSYANKGALGVHEKGEERPKGNAQIKDANEKQHEEDPDKPKVMEMVITKRTYVYTHARSADGTDQYGASTSSSPEPTSSRTGLTNRVNAAPAAGPMLTNFTNLKEGSFVAVRYRKVGDLNEVLNLTLIEMPLNPIDAGAPAPSPGATSGPARGTNSDPTPAPTGTTGTGTTGTGTTGTRTGTTGTGTTVTGTTGTTPAERVPTVPTTPAGAALPR